MKQLVVIIIVLPLTFFVSSVQASKLSNNRIQFNSWMGYITEKFIVPDGKNCIISMTMESMDRDGAYSIAISNVEENPTILFQITEGAIANDGTLVLDLHQTPVTPGMPIMVYVLYFTGDIEAFSISVPVKTGGIEIGHNDVFDPLNPPPPISEFGYTAFSLEYGCESGCANSELGNIDGKDGIMLNDAVLALKILAGFEPDDICLDADINGDDRIGMLELMFILQKISGFR